MNNLSTSLQESNTKVWGFFSFVHFRCCWMEQLKMFVFLRETDGAGRTSYRRAVWPACPLLRLFFVFFTKVLLFLNQSKITYLNQEEMFLTSKLNNLLLLFCTNYSPKSSSKLLQQQCCDVAIKWSYTSRTSAERSGRGQSL